MSNKRRLIYVTAFGRKQYIWMAEALLISIDSQAADEDIDILVCTTEHYKPVFARLAECMRLAVDIWTTDDRQDFHAASWARYEIVNYEAIARYESVLYLDTDILVTGDIALLFDHFESNVQAPLGGYSDGRKGGLRYVAERARRYYGTAYFEKQGDDPKFLQRHSFVSGVLIFRPASAAVEEVFKSVRQFCATMNAKHDDLHHFYKCDQPSINYLATVRGIVDPTALNGWAVHNPDHYSSDHPLLLHFVAAIGKVAKAQKMLNYINSWDSAPLALQMFSRTSQAEADPFDSHARWATSKLLLAE